MRQRLLATAFVRAATAVALALAAVFAVAGTATASRSQQTMLQDDVQILNTSNEQRSQRLDELKSLGVDIVKVRLSWRYIAPGSTSRTKPSGFDGGDPAAYPSGAWDRFDQVVAGARERGMGVLFQLGGSAPEWATGGKRNSGVAYPKPKEFRAFVKAVGTRYSGSYGSSSGGGSTPAPPGTPGLPVPLPLAGPGEVGAPQSDGALPRVTLYSVWNEPNLASWLSPQYKRGAPYSPYLYRKLLYAAADGLKDSGHERDELLLGELQPYAGIRTGSKKVRPLAFLRELACVNRRFGAYKGKAAKKRHCSGKFRKLPGTGLAYHPYTLAGGPNVKVRHRDDASIGTLSRVTRTLDKLGNKRRLVTRRLPVWITEFGFQSSPPDRYATPIGKIPGFLAQSERIAYRNGRVKSFSQYPLVDDRALGGFQSGLRFKNGKVKKAVYNGFRHGIYARRSGSRVEIFGVERAAGSGTVTIQSKRGKKGKWKTVGTAGVNSLGYFNRRVKGSRSAKYRFRFGNAKSRAASVKR
jgi:hypothetical protein